MIANSEYEQIVDDARVASGARLVVMTRKEPGSGPVGFIAWSGPESGVLKKTLAMLRTAAPTFDSNAIKHPADVNSFTEELYLNGRCVAATVEETGAGIVDDPVPSIGKTLGGVKFGYGCPLVVGNGVEGALVFFSPEPLDEEKRRTCKAFTRLASLAITQPSPPPHGPTDDARLRAMVEHSADGLVIVNRDLTVLFANSAAASVLGRSAEAQIGRPFELGHPSDGPREIRVAGKGTRDTIVEIRMAEVEWDGEPAFVASLRDISERKSSEQALRKSADQYRTLIDLSPDAILVHRDWMIVYANSAAAELMGTESAKELVGLSPMDFAVEDDRDTVRERIIRIYTGEDATAIRELKIIRPDGEVRDVESAASSILFDGSSASQVVLRDITERKRAEETRIAQAAALARTEEIQRSRRRLIAAQVAARKEVALQLHSSVQNKLLVMLHRLADLEQQASGDQAAEINELRHDIGESLMADIRDMSQELYPAIIRRGLVTGIQSLSDQFDSVLEIRLEVDPLITALEAHDRSYVPELVRLAAYRIIENALSNVSRHSGVDKARISLELPSANELKVEVSDHGRGFQMRESAIGVGIAAIRDLAKALTGRCQIRSSPGSGTAVTVELPFLEPDASLDDTGHRQRPGGSIPDESRRRLREIARAE